MTRRTLIGCALAIASAIGCNSIAGIHDPVDPAPTNSSSGGPTDDGGTTDDAVASDAPVTGVDRFVGIWTTTSGDQTLKNCSVAQDFPNQKLSLAITKGTNSNLVVTPGGDPSCHIQVSVSGDTLTALAGQSCTLQDTDPTAGTYKYTYTAQSTFKLQPGGATGIANIFASVDYEPQGIVCDFSEVAEYTKR